MVHTELAGWARGGSERRHLLRRFFCLAILALLWPLTDPAAHGGGEVAFTSHTIATQAENSYSVSAADLDGDGDMDVLSCSRLETSWHENIGGSPPGFVLHRINRGRYKSGSICAADLDGDGDLDVLTVPPAILSERILWYENDDEDRAGILARRLLAGDPWRARTKEGWRTARGFGALASWKRIPLRSKEVWENESELCSGGCDSWLGRSRPANSSGGGGDTLGACLPAGHGRSRFHLR